MLTVSNEYKKAVLSNARKFKLRCSINKKTYTEDNIQTINWSGGSIRGETFAIGSTVAADIKIVFSHIVEGIVEAQEFKVDIGVVLANGEVEYVPMGIFIVTAFDQKRNDNQTVIEGMDRFIRMEGIYQSSLHYPARIKDVATEIANLSGVSLNRACFERLLSERINKPEGYTLRQAIGLIAQFEGGFALFNRSGELEIRQLADPNYELDPSNYYSKGLSKNEALYRINGIQVKTGTSEGLLTIGNPTGNQILLDNKIMTQNLLTIINNRISSINFYPFQLKWQGDPALEAGDWLTIIDLKGNRFKVPNLNYSLSFNGGLSGNSSATQKSISQTSYQSRGILNQVISDIRGWISAEGGNWTYEGLDVPLNPKEGDTWFKPNGPDTEIWRYEKNEQEILDWVFKVSTAENAEIRKELKKQQVELTQTKQKLVAMNETVQQAITSAGFARDSLSAVENKVTQALRQAQDSYQKGQELLRNVTSLQGQTRDLTQITDRLSGVVTQSVQRTDFDKVKRLVLTNTATMEQTSQGLLLKADKTVVAGLTQEITRYGSEVSVQNNRIQSLVTETNGIKTKVSLLEQTQAGFQQTVTNQLTGFSSQQTQLAGQYQRVIESIGGIEAAINVSGKWESGSINGSTGLPFAFNTFVRTEFITVDPGRAYLPTKKDKTAKTMYFYWYDENKRKVSSGSGTTAQVAPANAKYLRAAAAAEGISPEKITFGIIEGTEYKAFTQPIRSQLIQTADRFNLMLAKGELLAQLNIEAGKTLIQNKKIFLDAETVAFSGKAFIPVALIKDLRVDAATIYGTLNAANVRVVNMDAANLSSGYINNARLRSQSITADKLAVNAIQVGFNTFSQSLKIDPYSLGFYSRNILSGRLTSEGMEFWYGSRKVGRIGESAKLGNESVRGITMELEDTGDYVSWAYRKNKTDRATASIMTLDPKGRFTGRAGVHITTDLHFSKVKPNQENARDFLEFAVMNYKNTLYSALTNASKKSGLLYGENSLYLLHNNGVIPVEDIKNVVYALKGLGRVSLPIGISTSGEVRAYKTITL